MQQSAGGSSSRCAIQALYLLAVGPAAPRGVFVASYERAGAVQTGWIVRAVTGRAQMYPARRMA
jgi:hypothetical protein